MKKIPYFITLSEEDRKSALEAVIFASEEALSTEMLKKICIEKDLDDFGNNGGSHGQKTMSDELQKQYDLDNDYFEGLINEINKDLFATNRPFEILHIAGGWQFATRPEYGRLLNHLIGSRSKRRLSQPALETLSIIAYRQPVTKPEIDYIRGVNSGESINTLVDKNLVRILGRKDTLGKPLLYGTSNEFLRVFGLNSLEELPKLREFEEMKDLKGIPEGAVDEIILIVEDDEALKKFRGGGDEHEESSPDDKIEQNK